MLNPKFRFYILFTVVVPLILSSCFKEDTDYNFTIKMDGTQGLKHDETEILVTYDLDEYSNYLSGGIYWGTNPNPDENDNEIEVINIKTGTRAFKLEKLHGNLTYYAKAFMIKPSLGNGNSEILYTDVMSFKTPQTPDTSCTTTVHEMAMEAFSSTTWTMDPLVGADQEYYYSLQSDFDLGNIEFRFKEEPLSGIYWTTANISPDDFEVSLLADIQQSWTCVYECTGNYPIYVFNDGNGGLEISFCDVSLATTGGCAPVHTLTGRVGY